MTVHWRYIVAAALVWFAWKGNVMDFQWPTDVPPAVEVTVERPSDEIVGYVRAVDPDKILPDDRAYLSAFYSALAFVLQRDADLQEPVITTNEKFAELQGGSLRFAIMADKVGEYPRLGEQIDEVFSAAVGDDVSSMTPAMRRKIVDVCNGLAWRFWINGE